MSGIFERIVGLTFILAPLILFSLWFFCSLLWIFSHFKKYQKDRYVFGMLFLGSVVGIVCAIVANMLWGECW